MQSGSDPDLQDDDNDEMEAMEDHSSRNMNVG